MNHRTEFPERMSAGQVDVAILTTMTKLSHVQRRETDMQRDMELVRDIFRAIIAKESLKEELVRVAGHDDAVVDRHMQLLHKAGYIEGSPFKRQIMVLDLTWEGHEFAGAILTEETVWTKVKEAFGPEKLATVPLKYIESVAMEALIAWGKQKLGLGP